MLTKPLRDRLIKTRRLLGLLARYGALEPLRDREKARRFWYSLWEAATRSDEAGRSTTPEGLVRMDIDQLFPQAPDIEVQLVNYKNVRGNVTILELLTMCQVIRSRKPKVLFEIGTFDGGSTIQFALNAAESGVVYTLDLPPEHPLKEDRSIVDNTPEEAGLRFRRSDVAGSIRQLYGDSRSFDFSPYRGQVDFVFIDASHTFDYVMSDSQNAFAMLAPGGIIFWHDYSDVWPDVKRALGVLARDRTIYSLNGTGTAVYIDR
jgi:hypothetical protein